MDSKRGKYRHVITAIALGTAGVAFRLWLTLTKAPPPNSDESTFGLAALRIARGEDFPVFLYGQHYMGTLESYVAAPFVALAGPTTEALRASTLIFFAGFLVVAFWMTRMLYGSGLAVVVTGLLALGSDRVVKDQLIADGSAELAVLCVLLVGIAADLGMRPGRRRLGRFALWGVIAGLSVWDHMLSFPYLAVAAAVLVVGCRRELRGRAGVATFAGLIAGAAPMILHGIGRPSHENFLHVLMYYNTVGSEASLLDRLHGGVMIGVPLATGVCQPNHCQPWQMAWAPVYLGLALIALTVGAILARRSTGAERVRHTAGAALAAAALITIVLYARSPSAADTPLESVRYLSVILVSTPAILWPLWTAVTRSTPWSAAEPTGAAGQPSRGLPMRLAAGAVAATFAAMSVLATAGLIAEAPNYSAHSQQQEQLTAAMKDLGIEHFYSGYWDCNRLAYATGESAVCAALDDELRPALNRMPGYAVGVRNADTAAYVTIAGSPFDRRVGEHLSKSGATMVTVGGYCIYLPPCNVAPPEETGADPW